MFLRKSLVLSLALGLAILFAGRTFAATEIGDSVTVTATVTAIDLDARTVDLKTKDGKTTTIVVPEEIANLDKLKVGDTVKTTYAVAIAAEILKPGETPAPASVSAAKQGGGEIVSARQESAVVKIKSIDLKTNSVTLTGPKGNTETVKVKRPELQEKLKTLKPGDEVQLTYTEAMAIKVEPKAAAAKKK
jgi:translation elongation factor P/translation initiation factor 5A